MAKRHVEIVVLKQLASYLAMPVFVIGPDGDLLFFNEPSEPILGDRFDEIGELTPEEWSVRFKSVDDHGAPVKDEHRPMISALTYGVPAHNRFWLEGLDSKRRHIEGTAIPLVNVDGEHLGAVGFFWELGPEGSRIPQARAMRHDSKYHAVETILTRRLASRLATPVFLVDCDGRLIYFNSAASQILGKSFDEVASMDRDELYTTFDPTCEEAEPVPFENHPLSIARLSQEPVHSRSRIVGLDGLRHLIEVTAIPLIGQCGRMLGAFGLFWEIENP